MLEFNQYEKSDKAPLVIYADLERLIEKIDQCKINPENSDKKSRRTYFIRLLNAYNKII